MPDEFLYSSGGVEFYLVDNEKNPTDDQNSIQIYVVYDTYTKDYTGSYVLRRHVSKKNRVEIDRRPIVSKKIDEIHAKIPKSATKLAPHKSDDPVILETWIK